MLFPHLYYCFIDYFNDPVTDGAVIYVGDIPFWYNEQEGMYTEILGNLTGNVFLVESRSHDFLLSHRGNALHASQSFAESRKSNDNMLKSLVPSQLFMHGYHLQTPVTSYTYPTLHEKEMPRHST